jgi:hypothetical protein
MHGSMHDRMMQMMQMMQDGQQGMHAQRLLTSAVIRAASDALRPPFRFWLGTPISFKNCERAVALADFAG